MRTIVSFLLAVFSLLMTLVCEATPVLATDVLPTKGYLLGCALVLVTHNIDEALILGDQVLAMAGGRVARQFDLQDQSWPRDVLAPQLIEIKRQILSEMEGENP